MQKSFRIFFAAALIALGFWGGIVLFPGPERVIRSLLNDLAETASSDSKQGAIAKAYDLQKIPDFFTPDVEINIDARGYPPMTLHDRDELMQIVAFARSRQGNVKVEFLDINVTLGPDKTSAVANLTCRIMLPGDRDSIVQEANFSLKKAEGKWRIYRVETVKTLAQPVATRPKKTHES
jgi:hypothetical protein